MYGLLGMDSMQTSRVLLYENVFVGALSLAIGLAAGIALSPAFGGLASFVFGVPWRFGFAFSENAALWDCGCFAAIMAVAMLAGMRGIRKRSLLQLMNANRVPEKPKGAGGAAMRVQAVLAFAAVVFVWGLCVLQPITFVVYILPLGILAVLATGVLFRTWTISYAKRAERNTERYLRGLRCFVVRQVESKVSATSIAMGCTCVLIAVAICMVVAGLAFSVGMRGPQTDGATASSLAPIGFVGIFFGMTFLVAAAAVLALQQLAEGADSVHRYRILDKMGCDSSMMRRAVWAQTGVYFAAPLAFALVHCVFGLALVGFLAAALGSSSFAVIVAGTVGGTVAFLGVYYLVTSLACERMLLGSVCH